MSINTIKSLFTDTEIEQKHSSGLADLSKTNKENFPSIPLDQFPEFELIGVGPFQLNFLMPLSVAVSRNDNIFSSTLDWPAYTDLSEAEKIAVLLIHFAMSDEFQSWSEYSFFGERPDYLEGCLMISDAISEMRQSKGMAFRKTLLDTQWAKQQNPSIFAYAWLIAHQVKNDGLTMAGELGGENRIKPI